jgi:nitrite reductase (NAD(P)H)
MVLRRIEAMGVKFITKVGVEDITTEAGSDEETFTGFNLSDGTHLASNLVIFAIGIKPRDELAKVSGIETYERGGIKVGDDLRTSAKDVYAIGECASWKGNTYGLIAPGGTCI